MGSFYDFEFIFLYHNLVLIFSCTIQMDEKALSTATFWSPYQIKQSTKNQIEKEGEISSLCLLLKQNQTKKYSCKAGTQHQLPTVFLPNIGFIFYFKYILWILRLVEATVKWYGECILLLNDVDLHLLRT